jgi:aspartyl aminopeptidase
MDDVLADLSSLRLYLDGSPSPWHAVRTSAERLRDGGFVELDERDSWSDVLDAGFVVRGGALIA